MRVFWRMSLVLGGLLLLGAAPVSATKLYGPVWINTSVGTLPGASGMTVKLCTNWNGTGLCYQDTTSPDCWGSTCYDSWYEVTVPDGYTWYIFAWGPGDIGSDTSPAHGRWMSGGPIITSLYLNGPVYSPFIIYTYPRPHSPSAIYPANGQQNAPLTFTLKWTSGIDSHRSHFTTTYDIYSHGEGGTDLLVASNISCNPDASGYCTMAAHNVKSSSYIYWRVVAKLNPGVFPTNPYYTTNSSVFTFTTLTDPNVTVSFMTNDWTHHLNPAGCGGGALTATSTTDGACESFKVVDHNGGDVMSGDAVSLQFGPWSVTATNGGGSTVTVSPTSGSSWETFTIVKLSGAPGTRILHGDRVAFQTTNGNYLSAVGDGGGSVTATPTSAGGPETFIYMVH